MQLKLLLASLLLFGIASAQAPKIKHVYKDKATYDGTGREITKDIVSYFDYSPTGKLFTSKFYVQGKGGIIRQFYYNKKDSLIREVNTGFLVETDSTVYTYSTNAEKLYVRDYFNGKQFREEKTTWYTNGNKSTEIDFFRDDTSSFAVLYDSTGKVITIKNSNEGIKYDKFGNMIQYSKDGTTLYYKYSADGKYKIEEELFSMDEMYNNKGTYSYTKDGYLYKTVMFTNGYMSKKSATSKMIYSDSMVIKNTYNEQNNKTSEFTYLKGDKIIREAFYSYDKDNRLIKETICKTVGVCAEVITYSYDKYGNILEETHYKGMNGTILDWKYVYTYEFY